MAVNDTIVQSTDGLADGGDFIIDGSGLGTGAGNITELSGTGGCDVYREIDPGGDGTYEISIIIDQPSGQWHSQGNQLRVSAASNARIRINNTSGGAADFYATGYEVDD